MTEGTVTGLSDTDLGASDERQVTFLEDTSIYRYSLWLSILLVGGYVSVFLIGLVGNLCVVVVVLRHRHMRSSATNQLIVNLAVVDIVVLLVCVPSNLLSNLIHREYMNVFYS